MKPKSRTKRFCVSRTNRKRWYSTEAAAIEAGKQHGRIFKCRYRAYECHIRGCGGWHNTREQR